MINLLIWSKDRASQLHLLLDSIEENAPGIFKSTIVYTYSSEDFGRGYDRVRKSYGDDCFFVDENDFDVRSEASVFEDLTRSVWEQDFGYVALSTDDTVIFRPMKMPTFPENCVSFSLRYGYNTVMQDCHKGLYQPPLSRVSTIVDEKGEQANDIILWPFAHYAPHHNYGYPFGLDMHIYRRELLMELTQYERFSNTNRLEILLFNKKHESPPYLSSFAQSVAVNIPANCMSGITQENGLGETTEYLNKEYLSGKRIKLRPIMDTHIIGSHQEIELEFE